MPWSVEFDGQTCVRRFRGDIRRGDLLESAAVMTSHPDSDDILWLLDDPSEATSFTLSDAEIQLEKAINGRRMFRFLRRWAVIARHQFAHDLFLRFQAGPPLPFEVGCFSNREDAMRWLKAPRNDSQAE